MTTPIPATRFAGPAAGRHLEQAAAALRSHGFTAEILDALRRVEDHCLPLESARTQAAYGSPSAINRLLILNAELHPGRGTVLLLREAIGF